MPKIWRIRSRIIRVAKSSLERVKGHRRQATQAILKDGWKLVHFIKLNETELFNLDEDIGERNDLSKNHPEKTREMLATLNEWAEDTQRK